MNSEMTKSAARSWRASRRSTAGRKETTLWPTRTWPELARRATLPADHRRKALRTIFLLRGYSRCADDDGGTAISPLVPRGKNRSMMMTSARPVWRRTEALALYELGTTLRIPQFSPDVQG